MPSKVMDFKAKYKQRGLGQPGSFIRFELTGDCADSVDGSELWMAWEDYELCRADYLDMLDQISFCDENPFDASLPGNTGTPPRRVDAGSIRQFLQVPTMPPSAP